MKVRPPHWLTLAALLVVSAAQAAPAHAVAITNRDERDHKITVIEDDGAKTVDFVLKPNQLLENICIKGCVIRLNDSEEDEYELVAGNEIVSIEDGYLYYDQPEEPVPAPSTPGATTPPPAAPPAGGKRG